MSQQIQNALPLFKWRFVFLKRDITATSGNTKFSYFIRGRPAPHSVRAGELIDSYAFLTRLYRRGGFKMALAASQQVRYFSLAFIALLLALLVSRSLDKVWAQSVTCRNVKNWTSPEPRRVMCTSSNDKSYGFELSLESRWCIKCRSVKLTITIVFDVSFIGGYGLWSEGEGVMDAHASLHLQQEHGRSRTYVQWKQHKLSDSEQRWWVQSNFVALCM